MARGLRSVPKALDPDRSKALAKKRSERFQTAGELQLALEDFLVRQRIPATMAHLSAFMRELYEKELGEEKLEIEHSSGAVDPRTPSRPPSRSKSSPLLVSDSSKSKLEPVSRSASSSRPSKATPGGRASRLVPDPLELSARRAQLQPADGTRGLLFNAVLQTVATLVSAAAEESVREAGGGRSTRTPGATPPPTSSGCSGEQRR